LESIITKHYNEYIEGYKAIDALRKYYADHFI
jgi:hypothetical protein